jgi:hypothetical protein
MLACLRIRSRFPQLAEHAEKHGLPTWVATGPDSLLLRVDMGVTAQFARFLIEARSQGVSYQKTLTLGRQNLYVEPAELERLFREQGCWPTGMSQEEFSRRLASSVYAEEFLRMLGAITVDSLDISDFEGATILHDLDREIPEQWHETFDCVIDGGLLEHVFNFPTAIRSCMAMLKRGGHLTLGTTANNFLGHGFSQFSPELFFRILCPENGFELVRMLIQENDLILTEALGLPFRAEYTGPRYAVADPAKLGQRVELTTSRPTVLFIVAKRTEIVLIFAMPPKQSDYAALWRAGETEQRLPAAYRPPWWRAMIEAMLRAVTPPSARAELKTWLLRKLREPMARRKFSQRARQQSLENKRFFEKVS